jgi:hypothetical protein
MFIAAGLSLFEDTVVVLNYKLIYSLHQPNHTLL